ncbi:MAG: hypothetical protein Fur0042_21660 [Cyanophyceae cyanobacterium]
MPMVGVLIGAIALLNAIAQVLLKLGAGRGINGHLLAGVGVYGLSTVLYVVVLGRSQLSLAYPTTIGLTIAATTFGGVWLLAERVPFLAWVGIGLILSGISAIAIAGLSQP